MRRRQGALIDLTGAILTAGPVPSPVHVSLAPACRRGWISLYAALAKGQIDGGDAREACSHLTPRPTVATGRARLRSA